MPLLLVFFLQIIIARKSTSALYETNCCLYTLAFGFVWAKMTVRLIVTKLLCSRCRPACHLIDRYSLKVAHMTKGEVYLTDSCLVGPMMLLLNQYFNFLFPEYHILWLCFVSVPDRWSSPAAFSQPTSSLIPSISRSTTSMTCWPTIAKCVCKSARIWVSTCFAWARCRQEPPHMRRYHSPSRRQSSNSASCESDANDSAPRRLSFIGTSFHQSQQQQQ
jgi:hypothetical protein